MDWMAMVLLAANGLTLAWAVRLLGRRPNRRLRLLVLTVSIVSISQTVAFACHTQGQSMMQAAAVLQQCVTSMGTLAAVYLLWVEMRDRNRTDRLLRLAEYENQERYEQLVRESRLTPRMLDAA